MRKILLSTLILSFLLAMVLIAAGGCALALSPQEQQSKLLAGVSEAAQKEGLDPAVVGDLNEAADAARNGDIDRICSAMDALSQDVPEGELPIGLWSDLWTVAGCYSGARGASDYWGVVDNCLKDEGMYDKY
jgi:hypothetical protein